MTSENVARLNANTSVVRGQASIGAILIDAGRLSIADAERVLSVQRQEKLRFGDAGLKLKVLTQADIDFALSRQFSYEILQRGVSRVSERIAAAYDPFSQQAEAFRAMRSHLMALRSDLAAYVLRTFVLSAGAGLDRVYWYAWDNGIMGLADRDGNPVEASDVAYQAAARWLTNRIVEKCSGDAAVWICALRHGAKQEWVLWRRGSVGLWTIPSTWKATQVENSRGEIRQLKNLTIELGPVPILVKGQ